MEQTARYDGLADWYDAEFNPTSLAGPAWELVTHLLGPGRGRLLDVGCGTGTFAAGLAQRGWDVTGVDISDDMLRRARSKGVRVVTADATSLPFDDASFDAAVSALTHTDFDDFARAVQQVARVLVLGGRFVYVGVHPCFVGPHSEFAFARGTPKLHGGWYRRTGRYDEAPGISPHGIRAKIGATHLPLGEFVGTFLSAGLTLEQFLEAGEFDYPHLIALRVRK